MNQKLQYWLDEFMLKDWMPYFWLGAMTILVYLPSIWFGLTLLDDNALITQNLPWLMNPANFINAFREELFHMPSGFYYRPLLNVSYMIDAMIGNGSLAVFHISNILIHLGTTFLVFRIFKQLKIDAMIALVAAAIFAVHPALVQAVVWLPGRANLLFGFLALASISTFIDWLQTRSWWSYGLHLLFFGLALFSKDSGMLVGVIALAFWWLLERKSFSYQKIILVFIPWLILSIIWFLARNGAINNPGAYTLAGAVKSIISSAPQILVSLGNIIAPINLSTYPILENASSLPGLIALAALIVFIWLAKIPNWKILFFSIFWWFLFLLPTFILPEQTSTQPFFLEQRLYLPIIGIILLVASSQYLAAWRNYWVSFLAISLVLLVILITSNISYAKNYRNALNFWRNAVSHSPTSSFAQKQLGVVYYLNGDLRMAKIQYDKALSLNPAESLVYNNLGLIAMDNGDLEQAKQLFKQELMINPNYDNALFNLGLVYFNLGDKNMAKEYWQKTLDVNPSHTDAKANLFILENEN